MGGGYYVWHPDGSSTVFRVGLEEQGLPIRQTIIWVKNSFTLGRQDYQWQHEPAVYGWKPGAAHYFCDKRNLSTVYEDKVDIAKMKKDEMRAMLERMLSDEVPTTVIHCDKPSRNGEHPTMKPVKLIAELIWNSSKPGWKVLDLFGGSGTTLIAAEQLNRDCRIMEYDPHYADVIIARWEKFTGHKAMKIEM